VLSEACQVVRPVSLCAATMAFVACVMAAGGWGARTVAFGVALVAVATVLVFQVHRAVEHLKGQSHRARRLAAEAERHYVEVLRRIIRYTEARDRYWQGHSDNVARLAGQIGQKLGLGQQRCRELVLAGELHDIGLLAVPEAVLLRNGRLGVEEFHAVRRHSEASYEVLKPLELMAAVLPAVRSHHERPNGTGYPDGLAGEQIPLEARVLAVADAYDAMTHDRPHRPAMAPHAAVRELRRCSPAGYDERCVEALAEVLHVPLAQRVPAAAPSDVSPGGELSAPRPA